MVLGTLLATTGCKKDCHCGETGIVPLRRVVKVTYDTTSGNYAFPLGGIAVRLSNQLDNTDLAGSTEANGQKVFEQVAAGLYNAAARLVLSRAQFEAITGTVTSQDSVVFNATLNNFRIANGTSDTIRLQLQFGTIGDWVIKQVYYAGSNTVTGAVQRDQFIEIYNNSNRVLYADSLYFAQAFGSNTVNPLYSTGYYINDGGPLQGQYDWSKSIGMAAGSAANTQYWYAKTIFRVPGNGTTYPVQPGESFTIASTAINHKAPYTSNTGTTINILNPELTVDLSRADFEVYLGNVIPNPLNTDIDNPLVPNLVVVDRGNNRDLVLDNPGRDAFVLFKTPQDVLGFYPRYPDPATLAITSDTRFYSQLPNGIVLDAVQIQPPAAANRVPRRLVYALDGGVTQVPAGSYSSQSIIRKTARKVGNRRVVTDTNNSTEDFSYLPKAELKAFKD